MKKASYITIIMLLSAPLLLPAQNNTKQPGHGEKLFRQQTEYLEFDSSNKNREIIWDVSNLTTDGQKQKSVHYHPRAKNNGDFYIMGKDTFPANEIREGELLTVRERGTAYYHHIRDNVCYLTGYENQTSQMHYPDPLPVMAYPATPGWKAEQEYSAECLYSSAVTLSLHGTYRIEAEAKGKMVLPSKDVLHDVVCVRSLQTIYSDTVESMDSIRVDTRIEKCRWYAPDSFHPLFETVKTTHYRGESEDVHTVAFFVYPEEQEETKTENIWQDLTFGISPNPVQSLLNIQLSLPVSVHNVRLEIHNTAGQPVLAEDKGAFPVGDCNFQLNLSSLPVKDYLLNIRLDDYVVSELIMKR
jgi:hypothetical protein